MALGKFLAFLFFVVVVALLILYWFFPSGSLDFQPGPVNNEFRMNSSEIPGSSEFQFYPSMRFPRKKITYAIEDCPLQKENNMQEALKIIEGLTILEYEEVESGEQLHITCEGRNVVKEDLFVAGEGGPTKIIKSGNYNVILGGKILLLRASECETPNVEIHELLHTLGFGHSNNKNNIMYPVYDCDQEIGTEIPSLINELYSVSANPDLAFEEVSASISRTYLNVNFTAVNIGLLPANESEVEIYVDDKLVKEYSLDKIDIGAGLVVSLGIPIRTFNAKEVVLVIDAPYSEISKENNRIVLNAQQE